MGVDAQMKFASALENQKEQQEFGFMCLLCHIESSSKEDLTLHQLAHHHQHTDEAPNKTDQDNLPQSLIVNVDNIHDVSDHEDLVECTETEDDEEEVQSEDLVFEEEIFECQECGKTFLDRQFLE